MVPNKESSTRHNQPWVNNTIKRLSQKKQHCYNRARKTGLEADWQKYQQIKRVSKHECRKALNNYISNLVSADSSTPTKKLWSYIKSQKRDHCSIGPLHDGGNTFTNPQDIYP